MTLSKILAYPVLMIAAFAVANAAYADNGIGAKLGLFGGNDAEPTVSIGARGNALVRGATVTSVGSGEIRAETSWNGADLSWDVDTDGDTAYLSVSGREANRDDIEVGDTVSFSGVLTGSLSVDAAIVRDWSDDDEDNADSRTHLTGEVLSVGSSSFVITSGNHRITVDVDSDTDITLGTKDAEFDDLSAGMKVRVIGAYDDDEEFTATSVVAVALKAKNDDHPWRPFLDFWGAWKMKWN